METSVMKCPIRGCNGEIAQAHRDSNFYYCKNCGTVVYKSVEK